MESPLNGTSQSFTASLRTVPTESMISTVASFGTKSAPRSALNSLKKKVYSATLDDRKMVNRRVALNAYRLATTLDKRLGITPNISAIV